MKKKRPEGGRAGGGREGGGGRGGRGGRKVIIMKSKRRLNQLHSLSKL